jgi:hypothetical protein
VKNRQQEISKNGNQIGFRFCFLQTSCAFDAVMLKPLYFAASTSKFAVIVVLAETSTSIFGFLPRPSRSRKRNLRPSLGFAGFDGFARALTRRSFHFVGHVIHDFDGMFSWFIEMNVEAAEIWPQNIFRCPATGMCSHVETAYAEAHFTQCRRGLNREDRAGARQLISGVHAIKKNAPRISGDLRNETLSNQTLPLLLRNIVYKLKLRIGLGALMVNDFSCQSWVSQSKAAIWPKSGVPSVY